MARLLPALLAVLAVGLSACGGSSSDSGKSDTTKKAAASAPAATQAPATRPSLAAVTTLDPRKAGSKPATGAAPEQVETLGDVLPVFKAAAAAGTCEKLLPLRHSFERPTGPGAPPTQDECSAFTQGDLALVKNLVPTASERFGTAATVDYTQDGKDVTGIWLLEADGRWRYLVRGGFLTHAVGSRPQDSTQFDAPVNDFMTGVAQKDCPAVFKNLDGTSPWLSPGETEKQFCDAIAPLYSRPNNFFKEGVDNPTAKPKLLGKTRLNGFYEIDLGGYYWIIVAKVTPGNTDDAVKAGHVADGVQAVYSGSFAKS